MTLLSPRSWEMTDLFLCRTQIRELPSTETTVSDRDTIKIRNTGMESSSVMYRSSSEILEIPFTITETILLRRRLTLLLRGSLRDRQAGGAYSGSGQFAVSASPAHGDCRGRCRISRRTKYNAAFMKNLQSARENCFSLYL